MFYSIATHPAIQAAHQAHQARQARQTRHSLNASAALGNAALQAFLESTFSDLKPESPAPTEPTAASAASAEKASESHFSLALDVPGLSREQIDIAIEADVVRISSTAEAPRKLSTAYRFPLEIDVQNSSAKLENGVLTLSLAKQIPQSNIAKLAIN